MKHRAGTHALEAEQDVLFHQVLDVVQKGKDNDVGKKAGRRSSCLQVVLVPHANLRVHWVQLLLPWLQLPCALCLLPAVRCLAPAVHDTCQKRTQAGIARSCSDDTPEKKIRNRSISFFT